MICTPSTSDSGQLLDPKSEIASATDWLFFQRRSYAVLIRAAFLANSFSQ
jgi:hypothetical protein